jgi:hypothetical protein
MTVHGITHGFIGLQQTCQILKILFETELDSLVDLKVALQPSQM